MLYVLWEASLLSFLSLMQSWLLPPYFTSCSPWHLRNKGWWERRQLQGGCFCSSLCTQLLAFCFKWEYGVGTYLSCMWNNVRFSEDVIFISFKSISLGSLNSVKLLHHIALLCSFSYGASRPKMWIEVM